MIMTSQAASTAPATEMRNRPTISPPTDIVEMQDSVLMLLDVPGAEADGVSVTLDKNVLTIQARARSTGREGYELVHAEYRDGDYERSFSLSEPVDQENISAVLEHGLLRLTLPKTRAATPKQIPVQAE